MSLKYIMTTLNTMQAKIDDLSQNQNKKHKYNDAKTATTNQ